MQNQIPKIIHEGEDYITVEFNKREFEITGEAITLIKSIIRSLKNK